MKPTAHPLRLAVLAQAAGVAVAGLALLGSDTVRDQPLLLVAIQAGVAVTVALIQRAPPWWLLIHLAFMPLLLLARRLHLPPLAWLAGFIVLLLIFGRTDKSRVPLYLTNTATAQELAALLGPSVKQVIDLGCGNAALLRTLARTRPDCQFVGIEHAPLTWLWARLRCRHLPNVHIRYGSFWSHPLSPYDLVYAFLSPAPMAELWTKARREMRRGSQLVSNSFAVPEIRPERVIDVADRRQTRLHCYRPGG